MERVNNGSVNAGSDAMRFYQAQDLLPAATHRKATDLSDADNGDDSKVLTFGCRV